LTERLDERAEHLLRMHAPQVLGGVIRRYGDFAAAEDAVQEALVAAVAQWPGDGIPDRPGAWLMQVAMRRMTDYFRSEAARRQRESVAFETVAQEVDAEASEEKDDALILIFMSCHPALTTASAIALTLRAVGGLTTAEIARAFLVRSPRWRSASAAPNKVFVRRGSASACLRRRNSGPVSRPCCTSSI
jgi:RNA polymerase sigma factor (sigma-70 family)